MGMERRRAWLMFAAYLIACHGPILNAQAGLPQRAPYRMPANESWSNSAPVPGSTEIQENTISETIVDESHVAASDPSMLDSFNLNYFAILYGPSLGEPGSLQPSPSGRLDPDRPLLVKNFASVGYDLTSNVALSGTAFWTWKPVRGQELTMMDPYVRVSHSSLINVGNFNHYADLRVHFPVTRASRDADMLAAAQTFHFSSYQIGDSRWTVGNYASVRVNYFGDFGSGRDMELYLGPNVSFQATPTVALELVYEMGASHDFGQRPWLFYSDGTDLEPGVSWDITPNLNVNPYLNLYPSDGITLKNTSFGLSLWWALL